MILFHQSFLLHNFFNVCLIKLIFLSKLWHVIFFRKAKKLLFRFVAPTPYVHWVNVILSSDVYHVNNRYQDNGVINNENKSEYIAIGTSQKLKKLQTSASATNVNKNTLKHID